jgi:hypothetical protein
MHFTQVTARYRNDDMLDRINTDTKQAYGFCVIIALNPNGRVLMTRNMELIRQILLEIKARRTTNPASLEIAGADRAVVFRHIEMLHQQGLIDIQGNIHRSSATGEIDQILVKDMTWDGHDFIGVLENEGVWNKIKQSFTPDELVGMTLTTMKTIGIGLLTEWAKSKVGLK